MGVVYKAEDTRLHRFSRRNFCSTRSRMIRRPYHDFGVRPRPHRQAGALPSNRTCWRNSSCKTAVQMECTHQLWLYRVFAPAFFLAAQRAFASADNFFRAAGLIDFRAVTFFAGAVFGADLPFCFAHRAFCAAEILARADALIVRLCGTGCDVSALGGRPRRGRDDTADPSRAAIA